MNLKSICLKLEPFDQSNFAYSGIILFKAAQLCNYGSFCKDARCVRFISGDLTDLTMSLNAAS